MKDYQENFIYTDNGGDAEIDWENYIQQEKDSHTHSIQTKKSDYCLRHQHSFKGKVCDFCSH